MNNQVQVSTADGQPLATAELQLTNAWWRAANYLSVGQLYLFGNPLLDEPLTRAPVMPRRLGHQGSTPGLDFIYVHLNRFNAIVAGKPPVPQWLDIPSAIKHCTTGISIWEWASSDHGGEPDVVMACASGVPTLEAQVAGDILRELSAKRTAAHMLQTIRHRLIEHWEYIRRASDDPPMVKN